MKMQIYEYLEFTFECGPHSLLWQRNNYHFWIAREREQKKNHDNIHQFIKYMCFAFRSIRSGAALVGVRLLLLILFMSLNFIAIFRIFGRQSANNRYYYITFSNGYLNGISCFICFMHILQLFFMGFRKPLPSTGIRTRAPHPPGGRLCMLCG